MLEKINRRNLGGGKRKHIQNRKKANKEPDSRLKQLDKEETVSGSG